MMYLLLTRCFLLLLLVGDWASDPYHGHSTLSRPLHSQLYCCDSIKPATAALCRFIGPLLLAAALPSLGTPLLSSFNLDSATLERDSALFPSINRLYLFMSIQQ